MSAQAQPDVNNAPRVQVFGNQPVIWVGDRMYALPAYNAAPAMTSHVPPVVDAAKPVAEPLMSLQGGYSGGVPAPQRSNTQTPFTGLDLQVLKQQQTFKKQELRTVEQTEVLQASHQSDAWRAGMIEKKRALIVELDLLRRQISAAEAEAAKDSFTSSIVPATATVPQAAPLAPFVPQLQQPLPQAMYPILAPSPFPSLMMYQPPFGTYQGNEAPQIGRNGQFVASSTENQITVPQSPGSSSRRSHAIEIKPPRDELRKQITSALDPKSPTYEPVTKVDIAKELAPPTPSPAKHSSPWHSREVLSQEASLSSIDTTDFFPTNTHEHSSTRIAPQTKNAAAPSTPEKPWPASPWNPRSNDNSSNRSGAIMPSWSEALVKQPSSSSIGHAMPNQSSANGQERASFIASEALKATHHGPDTGLRQSSNERPNTVDNWFIASNPVNHVPSTYQEGYQAGYDHMGLPDSHEVLQGFIQGMLQSIEDGKKGRISNHSTRNFPSAGSTTRSASLRGFLSSSAQHDSAVSMTFHRRDSANVAQENMRSAKANAMVAGPLHDSAYSPQGSVREPPISYTFCNEAAREPRPRNASSAMYPGTAEISDKIGSGYRHVAVPVAENDLDRKNQDKGILSRADSSLSSMAYPRQFSGNQLGNRGYGTPISMQRYYPTPKEYAPGSFSADVAPFARLAANQRLSGLDGAMDDLAGVVLNTHLNEQSQPQQTPTESVITDASCFKQSSSSKGKQKATYSPPKSVTGKGKEPVVSPPVNPSGSPKKTTEHSPAKAKLEQVTNKFRRSRKDDPRNLSPEEKEKHSKMWRKRFQKIKNDELRDINDYVRDNPRKTNDGPANQRR